MRNFFLLYLLALLSLPAAAQKSSADEKAVKAVINQFFEGMSRGDTLLLKSACMSEPVLQTWMADKEGNMKLYTEDFADLVNFVGTARQDKFEEKITFEQISLEKSLASAWTPYKFYLNDKISHCGTNSFQLVKTDQGWKIQYIIDTRRKGCK